MDSNTRNYPVNRVKKSGITKKNQRKSEEKSNKNQGGNMKKNWIRLTMAIAVLAVIMVAGCKDEVAVPDDPFDILNNYLIANGMDIDALLTNWIIAPDVLNSKRDSYYIMDIRTSDKDNNGITDYFDGHVPGAVFSSLGTIVEDATLADDPIVVVCYTGQSAGHAVMALRLSGYADAKVLKWGMSGWHSDFDLWSGNCAQLDHANWIAPPGDIAAAETFGYPAIDTDLTDGAAILAERIDAMLTGGFQGVTGVTVLDTPTDYFINNYWDATDVETYGNIDGAYRIKPLEFSNLNPDGTIVTYCWTGQTSSMITAYLTILGYNAKSLKYGSNSMIYDDLTAHKWSASMDYDYETSDPTLNILTTYMDENGMSFDELMNGWIIGPDAIVDVLDDYYIMDIRSGDSHGATALDPADGIPDYENGHVPGAVASSLGTIVDDAAAADSPIVVVCYTGQSAGHAVMALRLSGYSDAKVLKWGMSGWHSDFDKWTGNCAQLDHANWIAPPGEIIENQNFNPPILDSDETDGAALLAERVGAMLTGGFQGVTGVDVLDTPTDYFINNYWSEDDVITYGNIAGAYRIKPLVLENLNAGATVVTYCWTGQTSSMITSYLTVLGYTAKSLKFGSNCMIYDDLTAHKWNASMDYPYE